MRPEDRERVTVEVACRVLGEKLALSEKGGPSVDAWIHDTIYEEKKRLEREPRGPRRTEATARYDELKRRAIAASEQERKAILRGLIEEFTAEIAGNFDPRVYAAATSVVPTGLALLLNALSPRRILSQFPALPSLSTNVMIRGETETLKRLDQLGTVILCPTHGSNLDSIVVGWALHRLGLPPYIYGAGLNLFSNPVISFFMHNLGAYKVDRKKRDTDEEAEARVREQNEARKDIGLEPVLVERGGEFVSTVEVSAKYPDTFMGQEGETFLDQAEAEAGLMAALAREVAQLYYEHEEQFKKHKGR